ncbi:helix-turn-helix domain-containing protein [Butyricimonas faecihominis]|uniref:helix-turn-helix domain-containing protein n=1 Tax=Butyricimonas faecihominis TaxID=1472416 RepID=UPI0032C0F2F1
MDSKELQQIVAYGETSMVQFKEHFSNQDSIAAESCVCDDPINANEGANDHINDHINVNEGVNDHINGREGINETAALILAFLEKNPGAKGGEIMLFLQKGRATIVRYLRSLKEKELIEYRGSRKTGGYFKK